jgi:cation transport ATPase
MPQSIQKYSLVIYLFLMLFLTVGYLLYLWDGISDDFAKAPQGPTANLNANQSNSNKSANTANSNVNSTNRVANSASNTTNSNVSVNQTANTTNQAANVNQNVANAENTNSTSNTNQNSNVNNNANVDVSNKEMQKTRPILFVSYGKNGQILWLLIFAGILGAVIRCIYNFFTYWGKGEFDFVWIWYYLFSPFIGGALALVFYFIIRGGFFTANNDLGNLNNLNLYSFTGLSMLVGLFSREALRKLQTIAETVFVKVEKTKSEKQKTNNPANNSSNSASVDNSKDKQTNQEK